MTITIYHIYIVPPRTPKRSSPSFEPTSSSYDVRQLQSTCEIGASFPSSPARRQNVWESLISWIPICDSDSDTGIWAAAFSILLSKRVKRNARHPYSSSRLADILRLFPGITHNILRLMSTCRVALAFWRRCLEPDLAVNMPYEYDATGISDQFLCEHLNTLACGWHGYHYNLFNTASTTSVVELFPPKSGVMTLPSNSTELTAWLILAAGSV